MLCAKFGWKCSSGSGEEDVKKFSIMYFTFLQLSPLWEGHEPSFEKKLESSSPKDALC